MYETNQHYQRNSAPQNRPRLIIKSPIGEYRGVDGHFPIQNPPALLGLPFGSMPPTNPLPIQPVYDPVRPNIPKEDPIYFPPFRGPDSDPAPVYAGVLESYSAPGPMPMSGPYSNGIPKMPPVNRPMPLDLEALRLGSDRFQLDLRTDFDKQMDQWFKDIKLK